MEECAISTSTGTIKALHNPPPASSSMTTDERAASQPSSPHSALPSPPDSPSGSVSSLPSVSSSFFFSSGAASPHHQHSDHSRVESGELRLVIPSLTLPSAIPRVTTHGQTLGDLKLLILGRAGAGKTTLVNMLLENNDDVVEIGGWEYFDEQHRVNVLRASTDWIEHGDAHGLEKFEPARNVEIIELPGYDQYTEASCLTEYILSLIHAPFRTVNEMLNRDYAPSPALANLISSPYTPFYTALVLLKSSPSTLEHSLIESLSPHIPVILLPELPSKAASTSHLSSFRPATPAALRTGLFRSPDILATLRSEAADRFLRWREVERAVHSLTYTTLQQQYPTDNNNPRQSYRWNKEEWEAEWEYTLSKDVAATQRQRRRSTISAASSTSSSAYCQPAFDPLHLPSILMFSLSLLGPLRTRIFGSGNTLITNFFHREPFRNRTPRFMSWGFVTAVGAFCAGIGIGLLLSSTS